MAAHRGVSSHVGLFEFPLIKGDLKKNVFCGFLVTPPTAQVFEATCGYLGGHHGKRVVQHDTRAVLLSGEACPFYRREGWDQTQFSAAGNFSSSRLHPIVTPGRPGRVSVGAVLCTPGQTRASG